jgi:hypothetical protein
LSDTAGSKSREERVKEEREKILSRADTAERDRERDHNLEKERRDSRERDRSRERRDLKRERDNSRDRETKHSPPGHKRRESPPERDRAKVFRKKEYSEEERLKKLQEMQQNAADLEKERIARISKYNQEYTEETKEGLSKDNRKVTPQFINTMGKEVFTSGSTASVEDRIKRNKFYIQKDNLDERGIFK